MFCHNCGTQVHEDAIFCPNCGEKLIADEIVQTSIPQSYIIDTVQGEANQQVPPQKTLLKAVVAVVATIIAIVILISTGVLNRIWDTLKYIDDVTDAKASGATLEPAMKSASDMFSETQDASSSSSTNRSEGSFTETTGTTVKSPATIDDAMEIFEEWETTHPLDPDLHVNGGYDDVDNGVIRLFLHDYEYGYEYGTIEVDKIDGSMAIVIDFIEYDLDDWYAGDTSEGVNVEPEYNPYLNLDASLVGRWRSYDGGMLEFTDDGIINSCDFQCWSVFGETPGRIYWEASNGRVSCSSYFDRDVTYVISELSDGSERLVLSNNSDLKLNRVVGQNGNGIVGQWDSAYGNFWSFQFNADGTGMQNGTYPLTWYAYTADNGSSAVRYTLLDSTYFDYSVTGNLLTVFLSDGSRVYTKVGS